ncbi:MAG: cobyric acid synthase [Ruminococcus sp.]|nr:cobyric acid synthase [Ruminococcus sp.]
MGRAKAVMLQGTMSNVGKSFLTAALCRIFTEEGYRTAPFKSQNMALNSYITADGSEIGRAQAVQAMAAGIEPSALMNPVLLKPTTDVGSQVIVNGRVRGNMRARDYFARKKELIPEIMGAYERLSEEYDLIVIEGAGSPAELNLKKDDIVNMGLAKLVKAPVVLVGDIDRGGVFAQLLGTLDLLEEDERQLVKGLIVNGFRGDRRLFEDGVRILEERGGRPVLGVVPYIECDIEDEDSLAGRLQKEGPFRGEGDIDIAVIRLPRISNFTDLDVFGQYDGVSVRYVRKAEDLGRPDLLIIPGTKSTAADMEWLRESGMERAVLDCAGEGVPVFGICGGYQMMGLSISDPENAEGGAEINGMGLLNSRTVFEREKRQVRTAGKFLSPGGFFGCLAGADFYGYEIHMGRTADEGQPLTDAGGSWQGNAAGCYIHGIFDSADVSGRLVRALYERRGIRSHGRAVSMDSYRQEQFDLMAAGVREALDIKKIEEIFLRGV